MYNQEMQNIIDIFDCTVLLLSSLCLILSFLVRHNRMLNPCHEVNKLLNYGNKYSRLFNKGEFFIQKL